MAAPHLNSSSLSAHNLTELAHRLANASADAERHLHLRHGTQAPVPWVYAVWMCMLLLAVCASLRFMIEDIIRSSKAAAREQEAAREARAAQQADAAERGASGFNDHVQLEKREFFAVDEETRAVEVVVHWTTLPPRASVPTRRSRSSGSGSPVTPV